MLGAIARGKIGVGKRALVPPARFPAHMERFKVPYRLLVECSHETIFNSGRSREAFAQVCATIWLEKTVFMVCPFPFVCYQTEPQLSRLG